jgi:hypothetical protein
MSGRIVTYAHRYKRPPQESSTSGPTHRLMALAIYGLLVFAVAEPALGAADTFDGIYIGKRVLTKGPDPQCVPSEDVSVTIHGGVHVLMR